MTDKFLKINKDLFKLGLNPTELLILAQVIEFNTNTGDCYITDKQMAEQFNVSEKTISRGLSHLEEIGIIKRNTKNVKGGKVRHITASTVAIEECITTDKMSFVKQQRTKSPLTTDKKSFVNGQNDLIKDNIKDKIKDKQGGKAAPPPVVQEEKKENPNYTEVTLAQVKALEVTENIKLDITSWGCFTFNDRRFHIRDYNTIGGNES